MEEKVLLKERLQAITDKRHLQEDIRQYRLERDREQLKLQHLKKKALREQWLLEDSVSQKALQKQVPQEDQHQIRLLQSNIHRIEKEVESLERQEAVLSTNERRIVERLRAVEQSPEDIIKAASETYMPEPINITAIIPDLRESFSPQTDTHTKLERDRHILGLMEINVERDKRTGKSQVVSTATVTPQELRQHGVKVYDDGRKCVYAMHWDGGSHEQEGVAELSPSEVEQLLRGATEIRRRYETQPASHQQGSTHGNQQGPYYNGKQSYRYVHQQDCYYNNNQRGSHGNQQTSEWNRLCTYQVPRNNECPGIRSHDQEVAPDYRPKPCYRPANDISHNSGFNMKEEKELYSNSQSAPSSMFYCSTPLERGPSPLYEDNAPYSIISAIETTEPITAVFLGFQTSQDDSVQQPVHQGSIRAELVVIGEEHDEDGVSLAQFEKDSYGFSTVTPLKIMSLKGAEPGMTRGKTDRWTAGSRKVQRNYKHCCSVM
ncbi:palmdelphin [Aplochiton taeniatus]